MVSQLLRIIGLDSEFNNLNLKAPAGSAMSILEMTVRIQGSIQTESCAFLRFLLFYPWPQTGELRCARAGCNCSATLFRAPKVPEAIGSLPLLSLTGLPPPASAPPPVPETRRALPPPGSAPKLQPPHPDMSTLPHSLPPGLRSAGVRSDAPSQPCLPTFNTPTPHTHTLSPLYSLLGSFY